MLKYMLIAPRSNSFKVSNKKWVDLVHLQHIELKITFFVPSQFALFQEIFSILMYENDCKFGEGNGLFCVSYVFLINFLL